MKIIKEKLSWIDIVKPTEKDIEFVRAQDKFHPIILDELLHTSARARVEPYPHYLFLTYHIPMYDAITRTSRKAEIDFLITKTKIITVHYEELEPINSFWRKLSNDKRFRDSVLKENTGKAAYYLIEEILEFSNRQIRHIEESVADIARQLFQKKETKLLEHISYVKRNILDYRIINKPQEIILQSLKESGTEFWGESIRTYLSDLAGDHLKIVQQVENFKETVESLEETNAQLLAAKTNAVVQRFSVLAFLTFPLILVIGLFTVPAIDRFFEHLGGPLFFLGFVAAIAFNTVLFFFFKKRGWL